MGEIFKCINVWDDIFMRQLGIDQIRELLIL
jgi:hypothetical protein